MPEYQDNIRHGSVSIVITLCAGLSTVLPFNAVHQPIFKLLFPSNVHTLFLYNIQGVVAARGLWHHGLLPDMEVSDAGMLRSKPHTVYRLNLSQHISLPLQPLCSLSHYLDGHSVVSAGQGKLTSEGMMGGWLCCCRLSFK